jgi:sialic acid synthase SpsE
VRLAEYIKNFRSLTLSDKELIPPYIIAEAGVNHECVLDNAYRLIDDAYSAGATAIKFQTYKAGRLAVRNSPAYWDLNSEPETSQYKLFKKYDKFNQRDYYKLFQRCSDVGIEFLSTPFDLVSYDWIKELISIIKISSSDLNNLPFVEKLALSGKPVLLSTGAAHLWEVKRTTQLLESCNTSFGLMHCVLNYPTLDHDANLIFMKVLQKAFPDIPIGYSDHTKADSTEVLTTAYTLGARIIEKHFTFDKTKKGNDHYHSMDKRDLMLLRSKFDFIRGLLGNKIDEALIGELNARKFARRSIVTARAIAAGETITEEMISFKRPGTGIPPTELSNVVGRKTQKSIQRDTIIRPDMIDWNN